MPRTFGGRQRFASNRIGPPLDGEWVVPLTLRSEATLPVDLFRPFQAQQVRFSQQSGISWMDRVSPDARTEVLPITFVAIWVAVLAASWIWFLVIR